MSNLLFDYIQNVLAPKEYRLELKNRLENLCSLSGQTMSPGLTKWLEKTFGVEMVRVIQDYANLDGNKFPPEYFEKIKRLVPGNYKGYNANQGFRQLFDVNCLCPNVFTINSSDYGSLDFNLWTLNGNPLLSELALYGNVFQYDSEFGGKTLFYYDTSQTTTNFSILDEFSNPLSINTNKLSSLPPASCNKACYQVSFPYGYKISYFYTLDNIGGYGGNTLPTVDIDDEVGMYNFLSNILGPQIVITSVWDGNNFVVTINNAFNLGSLSFADASFTRTYFNNIQCTITPPAPQPFMPFQEYSIGARSGWSVRRINIFYGGPLMRVRRSSDNTEQDISYVGNNLDTSSLLSFVGSGDGFVSVWYDQGGNGYDFIQSTPSQQPKIVSAGVLLTENGIPSLSFDSANIVSMEISVANSVNFDWATSPGAGIGMFFVLKPKNQSGDQIIWDKGSSGVNGYYLGTNTASNTSFSVINSPAANTYTLNDSSTNLQVLSYFFRAGGGTISLDNTNVLTPLFSDPLPVNNPGSVVLGSSGSATDDFDGSISEVLFYIANYPNPSSTTGKDLIETNMNDYYNLY